MAVLGRSLLFELRSGNRKEGHVGFPSDGARKQRLAGPDVMNLTDQSDNEKTGKN